VRAKIPKPGVDGGSAEWGVPGTPRQPGDEVPLFDPSLAIGNYEAGRPSADDACRLGDPRVLAMRGTQEA
jgi:hydrogenase maturation protease